MLNNHSQLFFLTIFWIPVLKFPLWGFSLGHTADSSLGSLFLLQLCGESITSTAHVESPRYKMSTPWCFCESFIYKLNLWLWVPGVIISCPEFVVFRWCRSRTADLHQLQVNDFFPTIWKASGGTVFLLFSCHNRSHCIRVTAVLSLWQASQATM